MRAPRTAPRPGRGSTTRLGAALAALCAVGCALGASGARGATVEELAARAREVARQRDAITVQLFSLEARSDRQRDRLVEARRRATAVSLDLAVARAHAAGTTSRVQLAEARLAERIAALYREGDAGAAAALRFVRQVDPAENVSQEPLLSRIADEDRSLIGELEDALARSAESARALETAQRDLSEARRRIVAERAATERLVVEKRDYLSRLTNEQHVLAAEIQRALAAAAAAAERARRLAAEAAARASARTAAPTAAPPEGAPPAAPGAAAPAPAAAASLPDPGATAPGGPPAPPVTGTQVPVSATAYCLRGRTATGVHAGPGVIAVDPNVIPLGSRVNIPGYGEAVAADTGPAIQGNEVDVWLPSACTRWGRRSVTVTVYP